MAARLHRYTGLSEDYLLRTDLRVYAIRFIKELLRAEGLSVGLLDGRYVQDELESQNVFFPDEASLVEEGRDDLVQYADEQVTTGGEAEAYASFIDGHLQGIADGQTYSQIDDRGAAQAVTDARDAGASPDEIAELQATADELRAQRDSLFRGETLRGLLLTSFAWATVGEIAGYAAWAAFAGAAVMAGLVVAGLVPLRRHHA